MAIPNPPNTRGMSSADVYTRQPGLDTRSTLLRTRSRFGPYFKKTRIIPCLLSSMTLKFRMNPSSLISRTTSCFILEAGNIHFFMVSPVRVPNPGQQIRNRITH